MVSGTQYFCKISHESNLNGLSYVKRRGSLSYRTILNIFKIINPVSCLGRS